MRILPYRTLENVIEGAVITFTDITEYKQVKTALSEAHSPPGGGCCRHGARTAACARCHFACGPGEQCFLQHLPGNA
jgi:hypothetical protein